MKPKICFLLFMFVPCLINGEQIETKKSFLDILPGIAPIKATIQLLFGDKQGSEQTMNTMLNEGLITSQIKSAYLWLKGHGNQALETQKQFVKNLEPILDGIPIVGHLKGIGHILFKDNEHGFDAIKSASSSTGIVVGGVLGGPSGALVGHALSDVAISAIESAVNHEIKTYGLVDYGKNIRSASVGEHIDAAAGLLFDAFGGKMTKTKNNQNPKTSMPKSSIKLGEISEKKVNIHSDIYSPIRRSDIGEESSLYTILLEDENINTIRKREYEKVYLDDFQHEMDKIDRFQYSGEVLKYKEPMNLLKLDLNTLRNKLSYLSGDFKSEININDFKTVNSMHSDHVSCSLAGVLDINVESLHKLQGTNKLPDVISSSYIHETINEMKNSKFIVDFSASPTFEDLHALNNYLLENDKHLNSKPLIMEMQKVDGSSHTVGLKFKIVNNKPELLLMDYQKPGLRLPYLPNPDRFIPFIDKTFKKFTLYSMTIGTPIKMIQYNQLFQNTNNGVKSITS